MLSLDVMKKCAPTGVKKNITQDMVDTINNMKLDPDFAETYRENIVGYMSVLQDGRFKMNDYFNAVKYVSFKLMGDSNIKAYTKTFPDKHARWISLGVPDKQIHSYSTLYAKNKLVNLILEQSIIPFHVFNQEARQKALKTQVDLMMTAHSETVRSNAADSVLKHTAAPETAKIELDVTHKESSVIEDLRSAVLELTNQQREKVIDGTFTAKDIAHSKILKPEDTEEVSYV